MPTLVDARALTAGMALTAQVLILFSLIMFWFVHIYQIASSIFCNVATQAFDCSIEAVYNDDFYS